MITQQDKYKDFDVKEAKQYWIVLKDDGQYLIAFTSLAEDFDKPEHVEIREHFINSIRFLNDNQSEDESDNESDDDESDNESDDDE